ncbi:UDP-glucose 6-dehydrogenase YwqF [compost metagenome]
MLLEQGADIYAYDPVGAENFARLHPEGKRSKGSINYVADIEHALDGANVCFIFTEWGEIKAVPAETYKKLMRTPLLFDGRNIYDVEEMQEAGVEYRSIGREAASGKELREGKNNVLQYS